MKNAVTYVRISYRGQHGGLEPAFSSRQDVSASGSAATDRVRRRGPFQYERHLGALCDCGSWFAMLHPRRGPDVVVALVLRDRGLVLVAALLDDLKKHGERGCDRNNSQHTENYKTILQYNCTAKTCTAKIDSANISNCCNYTCTCTDYLNNCYFCFCG